MALLGDKRVSEKRASALQGGQRLSMPNDAQAKKKTHTFFKVIKKGCSWPRIIPDSQHVPCCILRAIVSLNIKTTA